MPGPEQEILTAYRECFGDKNTYCLHFRSALYCVIAKKWLFCDIRSPFMERALAKPIKSFEKIFSCTHHCFSYSEAELCRVFGFKDDDLSMLSGDQREAVMALRFSSFVLTLFRLAGVVEGQLYDSTPGSEWYLLVCAATAKDSEKNLDQLWVRVALKIIVEILSCLTAIYRQNADYLVTELADHLGPTLFSDPGESLSLLTNGVLNALAYLQAMKDTGYRNRCLNAITALRCAFFVDTSIFAHSCNEKHHHFKALMTKECVDALRVSSEPLIAAFVHDGLLERSWDVLCLLQGFPETLDQIIHPKGSCGGGSCACGSFSLGVREPTVTVGASHGKHGEKVAAGKGTKRYVLLQLSSFCCVYML